MAGVALGPPRHSHPKATLWGSPGTHSRSMRHHFALLLPIGEPIGKPEALEPVGAAPGSALLRGEQDGECGGKVVGAVQET